MHFYKNTASIFFTYKLWHASQSSELQNKSCKEDKNWELKCFTQIPKIIDIYFVKCTVF